MKAGRGRRRAAITLAAGYLACAPVLGDPPSPNLPEPGTRYATVGGNGVFEDCLPLTAGDTLEYEFLSDAELAFDVHFHVGDTTVYPVRSHAVRAEWQRLTTRVSQLYCLLWENRAEHPVQLRFTYRVVPQLES